MDSENEPDPVEYILWPTEEDYPRFVEVSDSIGATTYADFVSRAQPFVDALRAQGREFRIVQPDPDLMATWCRENFGKVDPASRAAYAAFVGLSEPTEADSVN
ncbi:MAG: hypothetical protein EON87_04455 [Brevundimonas sp.]|nr:MAG: hypothetical protein EON87_04455 [Brevundimonas sp.]